MSKIGKALNEIKSLDMLAREDSMINNIHPLSKLIVTLVYIFITVSFGKYALSGLLIMAVYPVVIFNITKLSFSEALYRLRIVLPLVCIVGIFNPFFDRETAFVIGKIEISRGVLSMLVLMLKAVLTVFAGYILAASTTINSVCYALRLLHVPSVLVTVIMLIYRYITLLLSEAKRVTDSYMLRAPTQKGIAFSAWGPLLGQMLLRSMDRAERVYQSMKLRGFTGEYPCRKHKAGAGDAAWVIIWTVLFICLRVFPVTEMIGRVL